MAKILIACIHYPIASGRYMARAFTRLGHEVKTIGPSTGNEIWGMKVDPKYEWNPDEIEPGWKQDIVIYAESAFEHFYLLDYDMPIVLWGVDNHVRDYARYKCDAMFLAHSWGARMNEPNAHWLPAGYDPEMHHIITGRDEESKIDLRILRDLDVAIIGWPAPNRVEIVNQMSEAGIRIAAQTGLLFDEYNQMYNRAKIALVQSVHGDLSQRFFENMAQGCCVLADRTIDAEKLGFVAGVDYWPYAGPEEAVRETRYLLDSGRWREIAANGQRKVVEHTWDKRCAKLLEVMEIK